MANLGWLVGPIPGILGSLSGMGSGDSFKESLFGKPAETKQLDVLGQGQKDFQDFIMQRLQQLLSPDTQSQLGGAAAKQFNEQTIPSLAERFTALGGDINRTGAFKRQVANAQSGMLGNLLQSQQQLVPSLLGGAFRPQFENILSPREPGFLDMLLQLLGQAGGQAAGAAAKAALL